MYGKVSYQPFSSGDGFSLRSRGKRVAVSPLPSVCCSPATLYVYKCLWYLIKGFKWRCKFFRLSQQLAGLAAATPEVQLKGSEAPPSRRQVRSFWKLLAVGGWGGVGGAPVCAAVDRTDGCICFWQRTKEGKSGGKRRHPVMLVHTHRDGNAPSRAPLLKSAL